MAGYVAGAIVVGSIAGSYIQGQAAKSAAQKQADAAARAQGQLLETGSAAADLYNPYVNKGITALNKMSEDPYFTQQFTNKDLNATLAPGYDFRLKQGQQANLMANNLSGGAVSGNALRSLQDYSQNFASGEYGTAFNQFQAQRSNIYSNLKDIANFGLTGTTGQANAMIGTGTNIASLTNAAGNAQAASQIAQGNAYSNMAGGITNAAAYYGMSQMNPYSGATASNLQSLNWQAPQIGGSVGGGGGGYGIQAPTTPIQIA
jgi:hypothetical protein